MRTVKAVVKTGGESLRNTSNNGNNNGNNTNYATVMFLKVRNWSPATPFSHRASESVGCAV